jgi:hypothetical protein
MRVETISTMFARSLGPELGTRMAAMFGEPAATQRSLQSFLGSVGATFPHALPQQALSAQRHPFSSGGFSSSVMQRPMGAFSQPGSQAEVRRLTESLNQLQGALTPGGSAGLAGGGGSSTEAMVAGGGANIDGMMAQAEQLMKSDNPSDQLRGQLLMTRAMRLFEMISKFLEQQSQLQAKAIQAIR